MFSINVNKRLMWMKLHYFLYLGGAAVVQGFSPTVAKQLGYSPMTVGFVYTYLSVLAFLVKPISGVVVDKFPVKKIMFLTAVAACGLSGFSLIFADKLPTESVADLHCAATTKLLVCSNHDDSLAKCDEKLSKLMRNNAKMVDCQLFCRYDELFWDEMCRPSKIVDYCNTRSNNTSENNDLGRLNVTLFVDPKQQAKQSYDFDVQSVRMNDTNSFSPVCRTPASTRCEIVCANDVMTKLSAVTEFEGSVFGLSQFWSFLIAISVFWISQSITWNLQDPICFDLLGDKPEGFGKQRCWGSMSWGIFSIVGGIIVDYFSDCDLHKNYSPIYYLCLLTIIVDVVIAYKIPVKETSGSKTISSDILKLILQLDVIVYFVWIVILGMCSSVVWNYLSWYMEDITMKYHSHQQAWIKTLQGTVSGIQCFSEIPFLFFSGWFIKRLGYWHCMSLGLIVFAIRFYLYSIITNPIWILPIEFTNGITFGLSHAVLIAYARSIAPEGAATTIVGLAGALYEGIGTSLGGCLSGILYEHYGGECTFKLFAFGSLSVGIFHILYSKFSWSYVQSLINQMNMRYHNLYKK